MPIMFRTNMGGLKGLFGLPIPEKPISISKVSAAMAEISRAKPAKLKPLEKDVLDTTPWYVETDKVLAEMRRTEALASVEDDINKAFGGVEV